MRKEFPGYSDKIFMDCVLLVENDTSVAESVVLALKVNGYRTVRAANLAEARQALQTTEFAAALLDINLPDGSGFTLCSEIVAAKPSLPVLMLTARTDEDSAVRGLSAGAVDYVRKPFGTTELVARLRRAIQRDIVATKILSFGELNLNSADRRVFFRDEQILLTPTELEILILLVRRAGGLVGKEQLMGFIDAEGDIFDSTLASHVSRLRTKLKKASRGKLRIAVVYGEGYRIESGEIE